MADLMHADAIQQLEVALLVSSADEVINLLSSALSQSRLVTVIVTAQPHPCTYTSTLPAPPPASVLVVVVSKCSLIPAMVTIESNSDEQIPTTPPKTKVFNIYVPVLKHCCTSTTLISLSISTTLSTSSITSFPVVVIPELVIPAEAYPEHVNRPGGAKEYLCHLCCFTHSNLDSILTHGRKHLDVTVGYPVCNRGYQNAASLCKHGRDIHKIQIVASSDSLQDVVVPKEEI